VQLLARSLEQRNASADGVSAQIAGRARKTRQQARGTRRPPGPPDAGLMQRFATILCSSSLQIQLVQQLADALDAGGAGALPLVDALKALKAAAAAAIEAAA